MDLADEVARSGYHPIRRVRITTPRGRVVETEVAGCDGLPGIGLSRSVLDDLIVHRARAAGAEVFERARAGGPIIADGRVVGLSARHSTLGAFEVRASVTIAANGRFSTLVRQTGRTRVRNRFRTRYFGLKRHLTVADGDATEPAGTVGLHLVPGAYGGTCRIEGGLTNFCALLPESVVRRHRGNLDRVVHDCLGRNPALARLAGSGVAAGDWKTVAGVRVEVSTPRLPGIFYAGDCQGTVDPLGGQGMTMALLGAEILAPLVRACPGLRPRGSAGTSARRPGGVAPPFRPPRAALPPAPPRPREPHSHRCRGIARSTRSPPLERLLSSDPRPGAGQRMTGCSATPEDPLPRPSAAYNRSSVRSDFLPQTFPGNEHEDPLCPRTGRLQRLLLHRGGTSVLAPSPQHPGDAGRFLLGPPRVRRSGG